MKKYILNFLLFGLITSCGPTDTQKNQMSNLISNWKNTSVKTMDLSKEIGDNYYLFQSKVMSETDTLEIINFKGNETNCEAAFEQMKADMDQFISSWQEKSEQVDELTNSMAVGKWTAEDQESLDSLDLELKQRDVTLVQMEKELEELNEKCEVKVAAAETNDTGS